MTDLEQLSVNVQRQIDAQNARIDSVLAKVDMLVTESQQQREDIRRAQEKHDADIRATNAKFEAMNAKIDSKFDKLGSQIQSLTIAAVVGVGVIVIGGGAIIWAAITSLK